MQAGLPSSGTNVSWKRPGGKTIAWCSGARRVVQLCVRVCVGRGGRVAASPPPPPPSPRRRASTCRCHRCARRGSRRGRRSTRSAAPASAANASGRTAAARPRRCSRCRREQRRRLAGARTRALVTRWPRAGSRSRAQSTAAATRAAPTGHVRYNSWTCPWLPARRWPHSGDRGANVWRSLDAAVLDVPHVRRVHLVVEE